MQLAAQLRGAGLLISVHDDVYVRTERDPWIFYDRGKQGEIVLTSDKGFMKSFPHMAAIALGNTTVLFFTKNNWLSDVRGKVFLAAKSRIFHALKKQKENFIGCINMTGSFTIIQKKPTPSRKLCDQRDWESYERVCKSAGISVDVSENDKDEHSPNA